MLAALLALALMLPVFPAADAAETIVYDLSVVKPADSDTADYDEHNVFIKAGDTILVTFKIQFSESASSYAIKWLQNEILYDTGFFYTTRTPGEGNLIDVSFVQYLGAPTVKLSSMSVTLTGPDTAVASFYLRAKTDLADGTTTTLKSEHMLAYDANNARYSVSSRDLTVTIGDKPLPTNTVKYNLAGGTMDATAFPETDAEYLYYDDEEPYYAQTVLTGTKIALPGAPTRDGHTFLGWGFGSQTYEAGASVTVTEDMVFTALWKEWPTVTLDPAGGVLSGSLSYKLRPGEALELPNAEREGYTFLGWFDGSNRVQNTYVVGEESVTLTAKWAKHYTITLDPNGGALSGETSITAAEGSTVSLPAPTRSGYQFSGWSDGGEAAIGGTYVMPSRNVTLKALWAENPTLLLDANGGTLGEGQSAYSLEPGSTVTLPVPVRVGYLFSGWSDGTTLYKTSYTIGSESVTLTAVWEECQHKSAKYELISSTDWEHDEGEHTHSRELCYSAVCPDCGEELTKIETETEGCRYYSDWTITAEGHYHACKVCGAPDEVCNHDFNEGICADCGFQNPNYVVISGGGDEDSGISAETEEGYTVDIKRLLNGISVDVKNAEGEKADAVPGGIKVAIDGVPSGQVLAMIDAKSGKLTGYVAKSYIEGSTVYAILPGSCIVKVVDNYKYFDDVYNGLWFKSAVDFVSSHELFNGTGGGMFSPSAPMTRAMLVTVLHRLEGLPAAGGINSFTDVKDGRWYTDAIIWANENKIVKGYGKGLFGTNDNVTREQMAVILYRYAQTQGVEGKTTSLEGFTDAESVSSWAVEAMQWAVGSGIITGKSGGIVPKGNASRAEVATMLMRLVKLMVM